MTGADITSLRRVYGEICRGYSETMWRDQNVYVAHLTVFDQTEIDAAQGAAFDEAVARGIRTEKERLKWLNDKSIWTAKHENDLRSERTYIDGLIQTRSKLGIKVQIAQIDKQLEEGRTKMDNMAMARARHIGLTAEKVAEQKVQYEYMRLSFFSDEALTHPLFDRAAMRELSDEESDDLLYSYVDVAARFSSDAIQRVALQPFFSNQFHLCGERLYDFFGMPIVDLTLYQTNLLSYGSYYQSVFRHHQVPKEIATDPAKVEDYITRSTNAKKIANQTSANEGGRVGIVGAGKEDFEAMGVEDGTKDMQKAVSKGYKDARGAATDMGYNDK